MNLSRKMIAVIAMIALFAAITGVCLYQINYPDSEVTKLTWQRTGGFIGINEKLVIESDGSASYRSNQFSDCELVLTEVKLKDLMSLVEKADFLTFDRSYAAKSGAADYFRYKLTVQTIPDTKTVEWVDVWASEKIIPSRLREIQFYIQIIIEDMHQNTGVSEEADRRAINIAMDFVAQAPTFKYDGISDTLIVTDSKILESLPTQYVITISFSSSHSGYGDREDQILAQVITSHTAVVKVVNDNIVSVILDNQWDELNQKSTR